MASNANEPVSVSDEPKSRRGRGNSENVRREQLEKIAEAAWFLLESELRRLKKRKQRPPKPGEPLHTLAKAFAITNPKLIEAHDKGAFLKGD